MKYYVYDNATRRIKSGAFEYSFEAIEQFGGSWRGVLRLEDSAAIEELAKFAVRLGIREITETEYADMLKKKAIFKRFSANLPSAPTLSRAAPLKVPAGHVAVVKETPDIITLEDKRPSSSDAILVGKAPYHDPLSDRTRPHYAKAWEGGK